MWPVATQREHWALTDLWVFTHNGCNLCCLSVRLTLNSSLGQFTRHRKTLFPTAAALMAQVCHSCMLALLRQIFPASSATLYYYGHSSICLI